MVLPCSWFRMIRPTPPWRQRRIRQISATHQPYPPGYVKEKSSFQYLTFMLKPTLNNIVYSFSCVNTECRGKNTDGSQYRETSHRQRHLQFRQIPPHGRSPNITWVLVIPREEYRKRSIRTRWCINPVHVLLLSGPHRLSRPTRGVPPYGALR